MYNIIENQLALGKSFRIPIAWSAPVLFCSTAPGGFYDEINFRTPIDEALGSLASLPNGNTDSRSTAQHLSNWQSVRDNLGVSVLSKLKRLSTSNEINLQWITSHVDLERNEIVDTLAKAGACEAPEPSAPVTLLEIFSKIKHQNKTAWIVPSEYHWYQ
ncbi:RNase H domain-containing protein [Trichonephila clavipes]|nr:RNase H domain-containing protein [Trichonephila clavipes]